MSDTDSALYVQMADNDDAGGPESQYLKNMFVFPSPQLLAKVAAADRPRRHLARRVFYLDTLENWRMNGLSELETTQERSDELASFEGKRESLTSPLRCLDLLLTSSHFLLLLTS